MTTTTMKFIREQQETVISALIPASLSGRRFRRFKEREDFRIWAETNAPACLRTFVVEDLVRYAPPVGGNSESEELITAVSVLVAYPGGDSQFDGRYGRDRDDSRDVITEDMHQIDTAIGHRGSANYVAGQNAAIADIKEIEEGEGVLFLSFEYTVNFRRAF